MHLLEKTIAFQNRAEEEFKRKKSIENIVKYVLALGIFIGSTLFAAFTFPFRYIFKKFTGKEKTGLLIGNDKNLELILKKER